MGTSTITYLSTITSLTVYTGTCTSVLTSTSTSRIYGSSGFFYSAFYSISVWVYIFSVTIYCLCDLWMLASMGMGPFVFYSLARGISMACSSTSHWISFFYSFFSRDLLMKAKRGLTGAGLSSGSYLLGC